MHGAILPLPNTPSWRGAQLKAQGQLYPYIYFHLLSVFVCLFVCFFLSFFLSLTVALSPPFCCSVQRCSFKAGKYLIPHKSAYYRCSMEPRPQTLWLRAKPRSSVLSSDWENIASKTFRNQSDSCHTATELITVCIHFFVNVLEYHLRCNEMHTLHISNSMEQSP
jgi:hypothetical protein